MTTPNFSAVIGKDHPEDDSYIYKVGTNVRNRVLEINESIQEIHDGNRREIRIKSLLKEAISNDDSLLFWVLVRYHDLDPFELDLYIKTVYDAPRVLRLSRMLYPNRFDNTQQVLKSIPAEIKGSVIIPVGYVEELEDEYVNRTHDKAAFFRIKLINAIDRNDINLLFVLLMRFSIYRNSVYNAVIVAAKGDRKLYKSTGELTDVGIMIDAVVISPALDSQQHQGYSSGPVSQLQPGYRGAVPAASPSPHQGYSSGPVVSVSQPQPGYRGAVPSASLSPYQGYSRGPVVSVSQPQPGYRGAVPAASPSPHQGYSSGPVVSVSQPQPGYRGAVPAASPSPHQGYSSGPVVSVSQPQPGYRGAVPAASPSPHQGYSRGPVVSVSQPQPGYRGAVPAASPSPHQGYSSGPVVSVSQPQPGYRGAVPAASPSPHQGYSSGPVVSVSQPQPGYRGAVPSASLSPYQGYSSGPVVSVSQPQQGYGSVPVSKFELPTQQMRVPMAAPPPSQQQQPSLQRGAVTCLDTADEWVRQRRTAQVSAGESRLSDDQVAASGNHLGDDEDEGDLMRVASTTSQISQISQVDPSGSNHPPRPGAPSLGVSSRMPGGPSSPTSPSLSQGSPLSMCSPLGVIFYDCNSVVGSDDEEESDAQRTAAVSSSGWCEEVPSDDEKAIIAQQLLESRRWYSGDRRVRSDSCFDSHSLLSTSCSLAAAAGGSDGGSEAPVAEGQDEVVTWEDGTTSDHKSGLITRMYTSQSRRHTHIFIDCRDLAPHHFEESDAGSHPAFDHFQKLAKNPRMVAARGQAGFKFNTEEDRVDQNVLTCKSKSAVHGGFRVFYEHKATAHKDGSDYKLFSLREKNPVVRKK